MGQVQEGATGLVVVVVWRALSIACGRVVAYPFSTGRLNSVDEAVQIQALGFPLQSGVVFVRRVGNLNLLYPVLPGTVAHDDARLTPTRSRDDHSDVFGLGAR